MRTWARRTAKAAMLTASFVTAGVGTAGLASAGVHITGGNNSILGGNQVNAPISIPVNVCGNAVALLGTALAGCKGGASVSRGAGDGEGGGSAWLTSGNNSIGGGNQVNAPVSVPVNACGNSAAALGKALSGCKGGASVSHGAGDGEGDGSAWITSGNNSIGGGNQVNAPVSVPVNICGNAAALLGVAIAGCQGGASVHTVGWWGDGSAWITSGNNSIGGGNQVNAPVKIPVNICGNAVAVLGTAIAHCKGGAWTAGEPATSSGMASLLAHRSYMSGMLPGLSQLPVLGSLPIQATQLGGLTGSAAGPAQASPLSA